MIEKINNREIKIGIKDWFIRKKFSDYERYALTAIISCEVTKETEKALCFKWNTDYGKLVKWIPKSCIEIIQ